MNHQTASCQGDWGQISMGTSEEERQPWRPVLLRAALNVNHDLISVMRLFCCSHTWWDVLLLCVFFPLGRIRNAPYLFSIWSHFDLKMVKAPFKSQARDSLSAMFFPFILHEKNSMDCLSWSVTKISTAGTTAVFAWLAEGLHSAAYKQ